MGNQTVIKDKFLKYIIIMACIIVPTIILADPNPYPEFDNYIKAFTHDQNYCSSNFTPEGLELIKHYFQYAVSICNGDSERLIYDPKMRAAYKYYLTKAQNGNGEAAYIIGWATLLSLGINGQYFTQENISNWFKKSAKDNYAPGISAYADNYKITSIRTKKDFNKVETKRFTLYSKAAKYNDHLGYVYLITYYIHKKNYKQALYWLQKARELNYLNSPELIAIDAAYSFNKELIPENDKRAVKLLKSILSYKNAGIKTIQVTLRILGQCYLDGTGVKKDLTQAYYYYRQAALLNDAYAQNKLGDMYAHGLGVKKDINKAKYWYGLAKKQGYPVKSPL